MNLSSKTGILNSNNVSNERENNNNPLGFESISDIFKNSGRVFLNLFLVYIFKYVSISGLSDRNTMEDTSSTNFLISNAYLFIQLIYNLGVFLGKSSLYCFTMGSIDIFTVASAILAGVMAWITFKEIEMLEISLTLMFLIGWVSGVSKSQAYNIFQENKEIKHENREVAVVLASVLTDISIVFSYGSSILFSVYLFPYKGKN